MIGCNPYLVELSILCPPVLVFVQSRVYRTCVMLTGTFLVEVKSFCLHFGRSTLHCTVTCIVRTAIALCELGGGGGEYLFRVVCTFGYCLTVGES